MASKFLNRKWENFDCYNCQCGPFSKFCSLVMDNTLMDNNIRHSVKFGHSVSIQDRDNGEEIKTETNLPSIDSDKHTLNDIQRRVNLSRGW